jgi:hypothetical protein
MPPLQAQSLDRVSCTRDRKGNQQVLGSVDESPRPYMRHSGWWRPRPGGHCRATQVANRGSGNPR